MMFVWSCFFLLLRILLTVKAVNHWIAKDNIIVSKPESAFLMRESQDLIGFLRQIRNSEFVDIAYNQLLRQRAKIVDNLQFSMEFGKDLVDEAKCAMDSFLLAKRTSYLNISMERIALPKLNKYKNQYLSSNEEPFCELILPNNPCEDSNELMTLEPEDEIIMDDIRINTDVLRHQAMELLQEEPKSWKSHLIASYYWRNRGNAKNALACACRALKLVDKEGKDLTLLNMGIILLRARLLKDAELMFLSALKVESGSVSAQAHLALGATLAFKHEFNRSLEHLEEAENLDVRLLPKTVPLRKFISCSDNLGKKMTKINSYVEFIKNEVGDFKRLKQQIKRCHESMMHQQVPLSSRQLHETTNNSDLLKRGQYCSTRKDSISDEAVLFCDFYTDMQMRLESKDIDITSLEKQIQISSEAVLKQVSKQLGQEDTFHKTHGLPILKRTIEETKERERDTKTWKS